MSRLVLIALLGLSACGSFAVPQPITAPAAPRGGERDARYEACRAEATRVVQYRDRGQQMRTDETESGRGTVTVAPFSRVENDRGAAQIDRDRLIADCLGRSERPVPAVTPTR